VVNEDQEGLGPGIAEIDEFEELLRVGLHNVKQECDLFGERVGFVH
jgi:hypothetical protein